MKTLYFLVAIIVQAVSLGALAMSKPLVADGSIEVQERFHVRGTSLENGWTQGQGFSFERGRYTLRFTKGSQEVREKHIPFFSGNRKNEYDYIPYVELSSGNQSVRFRIKSEPKGNAILIPGVKSKQNFNILVTTSTGERKANFRKEVEECYVKETCHSGGYRGYGRYGFGAGYGYTYGDSCSYAVGTQTVQFYDKITITHVQAKFLSLDNRPIAVFKGKSEESEEVKKELTSCRLNIRR